MLRFLLITFQPSLLDRTCLKCKTSLRCECWHFLMLLLLYRVNWPYLSKLQRFQRTSLNLSEQQSIVRQFEFSLKTGPEFLTQLTSKTYLVSDVHTNSPNPSVQKKNHSGEWFQKYAVSICGLTGFVWTEGRFLQKSIRIR